MRGFTPKQIAGGFREWRKTRMFRFSDTNATFGDLADFFDWMVIHYEPESEDKLISANSLLSKIEDSFNNAEGLPPMCAADFIRMIHDEPDARKGNKG